MRKVIAIFFTFLYLFNLTGYKLLFNYLIYQVNEKTIAQIDREDFTDAGLVEFKVPLMMPYPLNQQNYERVDGEIEIEGVHYNFVKRKWYNDTLYVMCLPNELKTDLYKAKNNFPANDITGNTGSPAKKGANPLVKKIIIETEYNAGRQYDLLLRYSIISRERHCLSSRLIFSSLGSPFKPPPINLG